MISADGVAGQRIELLTLTRKTTTRTGLETRPTTLDSEGRTYAQRLAGPYYLAATAGDLDATDGGVGGLAGRGCSILARVERNQAKAAALINMPMLTHW